MKSYRFSKIVIAACCALAPVWVQAQGRFIQAELDGAIKAKRAKPGDEVTFKTAASGTLPDGTSIGRGAEIYGEVKSADAKSVVIAITKISMDGKKKPMSFSIRAAMMPGGGDAPSGAVQTGTVIGLKGVTLHVEDTPPYATKFETEGKELQLRSGLQVMLQAMAPSGQ